MQKSRKHRSVRLRRSLPGQLPARLSQCLPCRVVGCRHPGQSKGVGLDGIRPGVKICPVHRQNALRVGPVCLLALLSGRCIIIGAHAAVEQQRAFFQDLMHIFHVEVLLFSWNIRTLV